MEISYNFFIFHEEAISAVSYDFVQIFHANSWNEAVSAILYNFVWIFHANSWKWGRFGCLVRFCTNFSCKFMKIRPLWLSCMILYEFFMKIHENETVSAVSYEFFMNFHGNCHFIILKNNEPWKFSLRKNLIFNFIKHANNSWFIKLMIIFTVTGRSFAKNYSND